MSEQLLQTLKNAEGQLLLKTNGDIFVVVNEEEHFLDHIEVGGDVRIFAQGFQMLLSYFIGYAPAIKMEERD